MKKLVIFFIITSLLSCSSAKISISDTSIKERKSIAYKDWGEAVNDADFISAKKLTDSIDALSAINGFNALYNGNISEADNYFKQIKRADYNFREAVILPYYFFRSMNKECIELAEILNNDKYSICKTYLSFPTWKIELNEKETIIPFHSINHGGTPIVEVKINGAIKRFMIDTGFSHTAISKKTAKDIQIKNANESINVYDSNNKSKYANIGYIEDFKLGDLSIHNQPVIITDLSLKFMGITVYNIDGVIGWDILQKMKVKMSWKNKYITLSKSENIRKSITNLNFINSPFIILQNSEGENFYFHFDTGSKSTHLFKKAASKINQKPAKEKRRLSFGVNSTKATKSKIYNHLSFSLMDKIFHFDKMDMFDEKNVNGFIIYDGRVGTDMFRNGTIEFDYNAGYIKYW